MGQAKRRQEPESSGRSSAWWLLPLVAVVVTGVWMLIRQSGVEQVEPLPKVVEASAKELPDDQVHAGYAGSESCKSCHEAEYERWKTSNHHFAERMVDGEMDHAAFEPAREIVHGSMKSEAKLDAAGLAQLLTQGKQSSKEVHSVRRVIGHSPLRQFLVEGPGNRLQAMELAWDPTKKEWFDVYGNEDRKPGEWGHWTGRGMNWNAQCASCHNTRPRKNYDPATDSYQTRMAEMSVGCEACHGPMKEHVDWQAKKPSLGAKDPTVQKQTRERMMETCAACHARRGELTGDLVPGEPFFDHFTLSIPDTTELFYPDGQIHDEDYEFTAFLGSRMHAAGVTCGDCHDPHTGKNLVVGNALCMRCHTGAPQPGISKVAPVVDPVSHGRHAEGSAGNLCVSCHMPVTTYMQRHPRHDHGFTIPDPKLTREYGIPNACNRCHEDKDAAWAEQKVEEWYGSRMNRPTRERAILFAQARRGVPAAREGLLKFLKEPNEPLWQASGCLLLGPWISVPGVAAALEAQLKHPSPMVREAAVRSLAPLGAGVAAKLRPLLEDASRNVRLAAAWALVGEVEPDSKVGKELRKMLDLNSDQPTGQMQLGQYEFNRGNAQKALEHFRKAVEWDPGSPPFHHDLAIALSATGEVSGAIRELQAAIRLAPENPDYHYKLALAWSEAGSLPNAIASLETAVKLDPGQPRAWYNLAVARLQNGQKAEAMEAAQRAFALDPSDPEIQQLMGSFGGRR